MRRPVALVVCNKGRPEDDAATRRAAEHLIKRVGVSAIATLTTRQALVTQRTIAESGASVLRVCEACGTELRATVQAIGEPSLVFQSSPSRASLTPMILKKLPELEALDDTLVINGSAAALHRGTNYLPVDYTTARTGGGPDRHEKTAAAVAAFRPHIVLAIAGDREIVTLLDAIERRLEAQGSYAPDTSRSVDAARRQSVVVQRWRARNRAIVSD